MFLRLFFICFSITFFGCREIIPVEEEQNISGYQINGFVTDASGNPIESVKVYLSYDKIKISSIPLDTVPLYISDPNINVSVDVLNIRNEFVANIFSGKLPVGPVPRYNWDGEIDSNNFVPSGYYKVVIYFNNQQVKEYPIVIEGNKTAESDKKGEFFIFNENLPIGKVYDRYDYLNRYIGTYKIVETVLLELEYKNIIKRGYVSLNINKVTKVSITL